MCKQCEGISCSMGGCIWLAWRGSERVTLQAAVCVAAGVGACLDVQLLVLLAGVASAGGDNARWQCVWSEIAREREKQQLCIQRVELGGMENEIGRVERRWLC